MKQHTHPLSAVFVVVILASIFCTAFAAPESTTGMQAFLASQKNPILVKYVYPYRLQQGRETDRMPSGALGVNAQWERKEKPNRYVEEQRRGTDFFIDPGLALGDAEAVKKGVALLEYGLAWERRDGSFSGNPDEFHSATFFLEGVAHGILLLRASGDPQYKRSIERSKYKIELLARRLMRPEIADAPKNIEDGKKFTHRDYSYAAAIAMAAEIVDLPGAQALAAQHAERSISQQLEDGTNPERGGFDIGYQAAGLLFAERYCYFCKDPALCKRIATMIDKALAALRVRLDADGKALPDSSTRIGHEKDREGFLKKVNYAVLVQVLATGAEITKKQEYGKLAETIGEKQVLPSLKK